MNGKVILMATTSGTSQRFVGTEKLQGMVNSIQGFALDTVL